jgi:hypothetical protein
MAGGFYLGGKFASVGIMAEATTANMVHQPQRWIFLIRIWKLRFGYRTIGSCSPRSLTARDAGWHFPWQDRHAHGRN